ncbi:MAG TPA: ABC transporter substrate-binding protein [Coriobacteriia bacterium]
MYQARTAQRRRTVWIAAALAALAFVLLTQAGCTKAAAPGATTVATSTVPVADTSEFPLKVTDDSFNEITFSVPPTRIVSLAPANTEIVYALGMFSHVVGVTTWDDYPSAVKDVAKVGDFTTPNLEAIAAARPDVILVTGGVQADVKAKLSALGAKVVVIDPKDIEGVYREIDLVGRILGVRAEGEKVVSKMRDDLSLIRAKVSAEPTVTAFIEIGWNPLYTAGPGTLLNDLLVQAGGVNVVREKGYVGYSVEQLVKDQPQVYLGTLSSIGTSTALAQRPGYAALSAIKSNQVFQLSDDLVSRPGPRIVEGVLEMAKALHPDQFSK